MEKWYNNQYVLWWFSGIFTNKMCTGKSWNPSFSLFFFPFWEFFSPSFYTPTTMVTGPACLDSQLSSSTLLIFSPPSYLASEGHGLRTWSGPWPGSLESRKLWARFFNLLLLLVYIVVIITCVVLRHQSINQNICESMCASLQQCTLSLSSSTCFLPLLSQPPLASLINLGTLWWVC